MIPCRVPLSDLDYGSEEEAAALRVLRSRWLSMGPEVEAFETEAGQFLGVRNACAVANGTAALHLALLALGIGPGDEVIQPGLNFVAAANVTIATGATPIFADIIGLDEPTVDAGAIERCITARTKAVLVMHYAGYPCRMAEIVAICRPRGIAIVEDACHAIGAGYSNALSRPPHGGLAGALGDVGCFSFFSNKNLAVGEGGLVVTNRADVADALRRLRSHGMTTLTWDRHRGHAATYDVTAHGFNYRLDELRAALARCQLKKLMRNNERRKVLVRRYFGALADLAGWQLPFIHRREEGAHHLMVALAPDVSVREHVRAQLAVSGIQTSVHYLCVADFAAFRRFRAASLERTREFARRAITLPLFPKMTDLLVDEVVVALRAAAGSACANLPSDVPETALAPSRASGVP